LDGRAKTAYTAWKRLSVEVDLPQLDILFQPVDGSRADAHVGCSIARPFLVLSNRNRDRGSDASVVV